jgi:hypothetical protein
LFLFLFLCFSSAVCSLILSKMLSISTLFLLVSIRAGEEGATLSLSSHGDRVGWLGRSLCSRLQDMALLVFHHSGRS